MATHFFHVSSVLRLFEMSSTRVHKPDWFPAQQKSPRFLWSFSFPCRNICVTCEAFCAQIQPSRLDLCPATTMCQVQEQESACRWTRIQSAAHSHRPTLCRSEARLL